MATILRFSSLECLNESASGSLGAGIATMAREEIPVVRGFVVNPLAFSDFIKKEEIAAALNLHITGAEEPRESWKNVKNMFNRARLSWNHEMEILSAFGEMDSAVSVIASSRMGGDESPVYANTGQDLLDGIKFCWLKWLKPNMDNLRERDLPAIVIREIFDTEASLELTKRGESIRIKAVFGLPEGLASPDISGDIYEFDGSGELQRLEQREQSFQYVIGCMGPEKVPLDKEFGIEEKASGEMLGAMKDIMRFMRESPSIYRVRACFISSRPIVCSAIISSEHEIIKEMPPREPSLTLMDARKTQPVVLDRGPVLAANLFVIIQGKDDLDKLEAGNVQGTVIGSSFPGKEVPGLLEELKRSFGISTVIIESDREKPQELALALQAITDKGLQPGVLIPGIRSPSELARIVSGIRLNVEYPVDIWVRIMYPSNLFFMNAMAEKVDVLALDLDMLGRLLLGADDDGRWMSQSIPALEKALSDSISDIGSQAGLAVLSRELVGLPGFLEFLVRRGLGTYCVNPEDYQTIRHIVASVEKRILLEAGRGS